MERYVTPDCLILKFDTCIQDIYSSRYSSEHGLVNCVKGNYLPFRREN